MNFQKDWSLIRRHFKASFGSSLHVSIATIDVNGYPHVSPIGSLFLQKDQPAGFYFEEFPGKLPVNLSLNPRVCVMGVNSGFRFWFKSLFNGAFSSYPALRLVGRVGDKRPATPIEMAAAEKRFRLFKRFKGHKLLWSELKTVRDIYFEEVVPVKIGKMTWHLQ